MGNSPLKKRALESVAETFPRPARPGLDVDWEDIGGLALTLALENASSPHTDEGSDASRRHVIPDASLLCKPPLPKRGGE